MQRYTVGEAARFLGATTDAIRQRMQHRAIKTALKDGTRYLLLDESETRHTTDADSGRDTESGVLISRLQAPSVVPTPMLRRADNPLSFQLMRIIAKPAISDLPPVWQERGESHAPVWIQEVMSKDILAFFAGVGHAREATRNLLMLDELRTADPRRMWRELAEFRQDAESLYNWRRQGGYDGSVQISCPAPSGISLPDQGADVLQPRRELRKGSRLVRRLLF